MWTGPGGYGKVSHMFGLGTTELIIVAGVMLLLFGARLPRVARSLGESFVELKRGLNSSEEERISQPNGHGTDTPKSQE